MAFNILIEPNVLKNNPIFSKSWIKSLLLPRNGLAAFSGILFIIYTIIPTSLYVFFDSEVVFIKLAVITCISIASMWIGSFIPLVDFQFKPTAFRLKINVNWFHFVVWTIFLIFVVITFATAPSIPIISSLQGASADELSQERGDFLKGRVGAEIILLYMSTIFTNTVIPYSIILMYSNKSKYRHLFASLFFIFCISFLVKALFLNLILPLLAYLAIVNKLNKKIIIIGGLGSVFLLIFSTVLSLDESHDSGGAASISAVEYMSAGYVPTSSLDYFAWRAFAVPIYTASDTLLVHEQQFREQPLMGATSNLLSTLFGLDRINLERFVFEHQFGSWNETANANAVFVVDAYANFGYLGVIIFGLFVGQIFRWFRLSSDIGFKSLWPLFAFVLFNASLIGMLLSNGFAYMLLHSLFFSITSDGKSYD